MRRRWRVRPVLFRMRYSCGISHGSIDSIGSASAPVAHSAYDICSNLCFVLLLKTMVSMSCKKVYNRVKCARLIRRSHPGYRGERWREPLPNTGSDPVRDAEIVGNPQAWKSCA
jgi:hypothetical protein